MDIRQRVLGEVAIRSGADVAGVEVGALLRRLLLFDKVLVKSLGLKDVPFLVRAFGNAGFLLLLNSGALELTSEFTQPVHSMKRNGIPAVPPLHFTFGTMDVPNREAILRRGLLGLQGIPGLKNPERTDLEQTVISRLVRPSPEYGAQVLAQLESDLRGNTPALGVAINQHLKSRLGATTPDIEVRIVETEPRVFRLVSALPKILNVSDSEAHEMLSPSISAIANLSQRIVDMAAFSAITGFAESEAPLLFGKFAGLLRTMNPKPAEDAFSRVVTISGLPDFAAAKRIDVEKLLKVRQSPECREFREWLSRLDKLSDEQIGEMVSGIREKIGSVLSTKTGKAMRFAFTTAVGMIPVIGLVAGPAAGVFDSFLLDRVFPSSGIVAFLTDTYPSLFESR